MRKAVYAAVPLLMLLCFFAGRHYSNGTAPPPDNTHRILYYVDPMHPAYRSDKPGIAPDCGMQLEPVYADGSGAGKASSSADSYGSGAVNLSAEQQQLIGLRVEPVAASSGMHQLRVLGRVVADEARVYKINASVDGYILDVGNFTTGSMVKKDELLASFGSTEIVAAEQTYVGSVTRAPESRFEVASNDWRNQVLTVHTSRLRAMGMSDIQLKELRTSMKVTDDIKIYSPASGFILARNISPGQRFDKGAELYRIADLSHVWIVADVYESELQTFRPGTVALVTLPNQKKTLRARVSKVLPQFDPVTRTMKLRLEAENPGYLLRPDMFADIELPVRIPAGLTVPADALIDSGMKKRVFVDRGNGYFEPREVETGWRYGDRVQVVSGLAAGDRVVVSGTFLVDSESRLRTPQQRASTSNSDVAIPGTRSSAVPSMDEGSAPAMKSSTTKVRMQAADLPVSAKDPSCGMEVKPSESIAAGNTETYQGKTYYFCSSSCLNKFHKDPQHFLASKSREAIAASGSSMEMPKEKGSGHD